MRRFRRVASLGLLTLALGAAGACSKSQVEAQLPGVDAAWTAGCTAAGVAIGVNRREREAEIGTLRTAADVAGIDTDYKQWVDRAVQLLQLAEPTRAPLELRRAVNSPCKAHGHSISALNTG
ncbi:MAG: hypothetical protein ACTHMS_17555 [Jatrophihabitans sp.]|uniref:hypothetical protein n=1 Tax=Jatrophihabitans sp. TaxID=1932789 RepID=UPI003F7F4A7A